MVPFQCFRVKESDFPMLVVSRCPGPVRETCTTMDFM